MKLIINFQKKKPDDFEIADTLEHIAGKVREGYSSGIDQPANVYSWELR
jgi:hypothetical protein